MSIPYEKQILIIDDSPESIELASCILKRSDFTIRVAKSAQSALKLLQFQIPHIILLDVTMPEMNGFDFCQLLKNNVEYKKIPVVFLTASDDEESIKKAFAIGAQDYVTKPFKPAELIARVNTQLKLMQRTEDLENAYKSLDSFSYSVAHDLKSPLLSIKRLIDFLLQDCNGKFSSDEKTLAENIQEKTREVTAIIDHLLEYSHAGSKEISINKIDTNKIFFETYNELHTLEPSRKICFHLEKLPSIAADPILFKLLCQNILSNALKYTRKKDPAIIRVTCRQTEKYLVFSVTDNGAGFDMRYVKKLFHVFERLHSAREFEGSGVGLAICQRILQRQGGTAWITGKPDKGASFFFSLPCKAADEL
ncbi:hybrid sensor histidine kinase/response regulator [Pectinatus haikarae]|uniref:histidine kinase n=1 Tax=Pectinatus haikarae TaxID=349096 RepID=A0ABT9Y4Z4_9FIRM|nr:response regulator [Pectinatus haikarae]MDQ0202708.1 signal transduction histidine kinase [Pectinatus haikarae]